MKYLTLFIASLIFLTCQTDTNPILPQELTGEFPLSVGNTWEYSVQDTTHYFHFEDSVQVNNGTMQVRIVWKVVRDNGDEQYFWEYRFNGEVIDTLPVVLSQNTLIFYSVDDRYLKWMLVFPLYVGKTWQNLGCDNYQVIRKEKLTIPPNRSTIAFVVKRDFLCEIEAALMEYYYVNFSVGLVQYESEYVNYRYGISRFRHWKLKSYHVNPS